jgi:hypothetical protein
MLEGMRQRLSYDPRGKVYGPLSLASSAVQHQIRPDYSLSARAVYTNLSNTLIQGSCTLDIVSCVRVSSKSDFNLLLFVPDRSSGSMLRQGVTYFIRLQMLRKETYDASPDSSPVFYLLESAVALTKPNTIDAIRDFADYERPEEDDHTWAIPTKRIDNFRRMIEAHKFHSLYKSASAAFWRAMCGDIISFSVQPQLPTFPDLRPPSLCRRSISLYPAHELA